MRPAQGLAAEGKSCGTVVVVPSRGFRAGRNKQAGKLIRAPMRRVWALLYGVVLWSLKHVWPQQARPAVFLTCTPPPEAVWPDAALPKDHMPERLETGLQLSPAA
jgi:hypothetical protein